MFEAVEVGARVDKAEYEAQVPQLRVELLNAQFDLRLADFPAIVLIFGNDDQGRNEIVNLCNAWLDARYLRTFAFGPPRRDERRYPPFWRYWRTLPGKGQLAIYVGGWAMDAVAGHYTGRLDAIAFERQIAHIQRFEQTLIEDGALILKFWLHLSRKALKRRLKAARRNPGRYVHLDDADWQIYETYDAAMAVAEHLLRKTSSGEAPWHMVEAADERHRNLSVMRTLLEGLQTRLAQPRAPTWAEAPLRVRRLQQDPLTILDAVDLSRSLDKADYDERLPRLQGKLQRRSRQARARGIAAVLVFEGWDAAGKGGTIRRITAALDARDYRVVPIAAPSEEERAHHYLWRFWRHLPAPGEMVIFDRSWYGRVLVERVEGYAREHEWRRAYSEINDFEEQLSESGMVLLKFWLHIDADEQLKRFREREQTPYKKYKITDEDYRNRERRLDYEAAVNDMVAQTSIAQAPWHIIAANDKRWARIEVLKIVCQSLKRAIDGR
ncbi:MAG TPA: polyphosphate:AMP phosphotransferase [Candidatus Competibacteraceae bacterium]|nr:polyphosphate:AMP phosphotransferase [Candidatus Competibacteraceae bacterium]